MPKLLVILLLTVPALACTDLATASVANGEAAAKCEAATDALLEPGDGMLPGRQCLTCHVSGAEAEDEALSAGGTVFQKGTDDCNPGGISGVVVELLKGGTVVARATTGPGGNFHLKQAVDFSGGLEARITYGGKVHSMPDPVTNGNCASCHNTVTAPRINVEAD